MLDFDAIGYQQTNEMSFMQPNFYLITLSAIFQGFSAKDSEANYQSTILVNAASMQVTEASVISSVRIKMIDFIKNHLEKISQEFPKHFSEFMIAEIAKNHSHTSALYNNEIETLQDLVNVFGVIGEHINCDICDELQFTISSQSVKCICQPS